MEQQSLRMAGLACAKVMREEISAEVSALAEQGITPKLCVVRVGENPDDIAYQESIERCFAKLGLAVECRAFAATATETELIDTMQALSADATVHGVLLFMPLPKGLSSDNILAHLAPEKDVDGATLASMASVYSGKGEGFVPCTAQACLDILKFYEIPLSGKRAVIVGRSLVVGKPLAMLLLGENATVTTCHSRSQDLPGLCREADILVAAVGRKNMITSDFVSPGQTVVDVGIHVLPDGGLTGDVDMDSVKEIVSAYTPVPGGVGTITTVILAKNTVRAAKG
ncbi:MAG: bifunctional 5,10-methylenetetrahydrofolate dehydrogenase/5,10-methenyltetrahydrofolate cyclohydrolase [Clostridiales bacterium]|nr:bifunctional 5,10-methylenetetrahydrofolate dehydrogenase/5,10-methenyltetrahydrofolate cyclohydrolase [Clostridiales bacterium]